MVEFGLQHTDAVEGRLLAVPGRMPDRGGGLGFAPPEHEPAHHDRPLVRWGRGEHDDHRRLANLHLVVPGRVQQVLSAAASPQARAGVVQADPIDPAGWVLETGDSARC